MSNAFDTATDANATPPPGVLTGSTGKGDTPAAATKSFDDLTSDKYDAITKADSDLLKKKIGSEGGMAAAEQRRDEQYRTRMDRMIGAEGATIDELKPWNAEKELAKRETNLWEQFGSPGFVISMLASAFTAMPMNSALSGGAAAMNAINAGKMDEYHKAFDAWKENSNLTLKRLDLEEKQFNQIDTLRTKDMESWRAQAMALAARFNDQRMLVMLTNGYDQQALEARDQLAKSRVELSDATNRIQDNEIRRKLFMALNGDNKDPKKLAQAAMDAETIMSAPKTPEQIAVANVISQPGFRDQSSEDQNKQINNAIAGVSSARYGGRGTNALPVELQKQIDASDAAIGPNETPEDTRARHNQVMSDFYTAKNPVGAERNKITQAHQQTMEDLTSRKIDIEEAKAQEDALHKKNMDAIAQGRLEGQMTAQQEKTRHDQATEEIAKQKNSAGNITPNKRAELTQLETRYQVNDDIIGDVINTLKRDPSGAGLKGKVMRLEERLANILGGTSSTKYVEVMRQIETARALTPRLLIGGSSRPLKTEADRMDSIVPGLTIGDTWQNTIAGLQKLKETLDKEHLTVKKILGDTSSATETPAKPAAGDWPGVPVGQ
jgi:hypothetical protein